MASPPADLLLRRDKGRLVYVPSARARNAYRHSVEYEMSDWAVADVFHEEKGMRPADRAAFDLLVAGQGLLLITGTPGIPEDMIDATITIQDEGSKSDVMIVNEMIAVLNSVA